jgi:hypothetical protein
MPEEKEPVLVGSWETFLKYGGMKRARDSVRLPYAGLYDRREKRGAIIDAAKAAGADIVFCRDSGRGFLARFYRKAPDAGSEPELNE